MHNISRGLDEKDVKLSRKNVVGEANKDFGAKSEKLDPHCRWFFSEQCLV